MSAQKFGRRVEHEIDAELERPLVVGRGEGRVDDGLDAVARADVGEALEIEDAVVRDWSATR